MSELSFDRHRRLRQSASIRRMVRETTLSQDDFIYPIFVKESGSEVTEVASMPGVFQWPLHEVLNEVKEVVELGIPSIILLVFPQKRMQKEPRPSMITELCKKPLESLKKHTLS